jgi:DNA polymerase III subunit delta
VDIHALIDRAEQGHYGCVHLIVGSERLFIDRAVSALRRASVGEGGGWNEEVFQAKSASAARIVDAARTLPMLGRVRFVLVRSLHELPEKEVERLAAYIAAPVDTCCLVLTADKLDGRSKLMKLAKQKDLLCEAQPLKQAMMRGFASREASRRKLRIDDAAIAGLVDCVGTDVSALDDAFTRLSLYVGIGQPIDLGAVEACISRVRVESIWALVDAVSARDRRTALKAAGSLLGDREPPLRILALLSRQLRLVGRARQALDDGASPDAAAAAAGAPPFKARDLAFAARRMSMPELQRAFRILSEADLAQKGGKCPPDVALEGAILELTSGDARS